jgi:hypothetical protein
MASPSAPFGAPPVSPFSGIGTSTIANPRVTNYGTGGMQLPPGSAPNSR